MKKMFLTLFIALATVINMQALSHSAIRNNARFLSDRMAYELDLAPWQYEECYEINYDFIYAINYIMDDVVFGYYDAVDRYYSLLDDRNDDMRYVLSSAQFRKFMSREYFYRPVYTSGRKWAFRIYTIYSNTSFYYYDAPRGLKSYHGEHGRSHHTGGYYATRKPAHGGQHEIYMGSDHRISGSSHHQDYGRGDFGANRVQRPHDNSKPQRDNYYSNGNQKDRTRDSRYHDNSGNTESPKINKRGDKPGQPQQGTGRSQHDDGKPHQSGSSKPSGSGTSGQPQSHRR